MAEGMTAWTRSGYRVTIERLYYTGGQRVARIRYTDGREDSVLASSLLVRA